MVIVLGVFLDFLKKIGLLSMLVSSLFIKAEQTLFISPELITQTKHALESGEEPRQLCFLFDLHHVLFKHVPQPYISSTLKIKRKPTFILQALRTSVSYTFWKNVKKLRKQKNKVAEAYISSLKKGSTLHDGLLNFMTDLYMPTMDMYHHTKELKQQGHRLYLLSNIGPDLLIKLQQRYPKFFRHFNRQQNTINYDAYITHTWLSKPHITSYQHALHVINMQNKACFCVFVDDKIANINGARQAGLNAILFKSPEQFKHDVQILLHSLQTIVST